MKKININRIRNRIFLFITLLSLNISPKSAYAGGNGIENSKFGVGTKNIFNDLSAYLLVLSPIVGAVCAIYFLIRKNGADEQDQKQWNKRLVTTGICVVGAVLVSSMINVFTGYYK